ncbi:MAG: type II secretion system major pseudopilin GspG [Candidatus Omnitrophica bacterium]|nr:type II secretion system major pseudopilin GspG [Candidatus Omnitrophota bacterium]MDE2222936.1 type II secretion system major pseudopilin GspG [Candidatus Omnitrophota bacterium]
MLKHKGTGFTLIEIMLVVIIIGILVAMLVPNIAGRSEQARNTAARTDIESNLSTALDLYRMDVGQYPTTEQGLSALIAAPTIPPVPPQWNGPYLKKKKVPKDPWGRDYVYAAPGTHNPESYDLSSVGPDGVEDAKSINNWGNEEK